jgi:hypothetical protein
MRNAVGFPFPPLPGESPDEKGRHEAGLRAVDLDQKLRAQAYRTLTGTSVEVRMAWL